MKVRNLLTITTILLSLSSASAKEMFSPNISLIRPWKKDFYDKHPYQPFPKTVFFKTTRGQKELSFIATKHKDWKKSQQIIESTILEKKPEILLIEGIKKSDGLSPRVWVDKIKQDLNKEGLEGYFAYKIALEQGIPVVGAELEGKMSNFTSYQRDIAVVTYFAELLSRYNRVMVIYGAGHFVQQELVLSDMLGSPITIQ